MRLRHYGATPTSSVQCFRHEYQFQLSYEVFRLGISIKSRFSSRPRFGVNLIAAGNSDNEAEMLASEVEYSIQDELCSLSTCYVVLSLSLIQDLSHPLADFTMSNDP